MKPRYQVSRTAIELAKRFEGYRRSSAKLADGRWTIGYGHTLTAREGVDVNEADAEALLIYDLMQAGNLVCDHVFTPLTQNQFDALTCFVFGIGAETFKASNVLRLLNEGACLQAAAAMEAWRKTEFEGEPVVVDALIRRRAAEKMLFLTPSKGFVPVPGAVAPPQLDTEAAFAAPVELEPRMGNGEASLRRMERGREREDEAQDYLPMDYPPEDISRAGEGPQERRAQPEVAVAAEGELEEPLYKLPGYAPEDGFHPVSKPRAPMRTWQLVVIGLGGLGLLFGAFVLALRASSGGGTVLYALASIAGLAGAAGLFAAIYLILNRLDRD